MTRSVKPPRKLDYPAPSTVIVREKFRVSCWCFCASREDFIGTLLTRTSEHRCFIVTRDQPCWLSFFRVDVTLSFLEQHQINILVNAAFYVYLRTWTPILVSGHRADSVFKSALLKGRERYSNRNHEMLYKFKFNSRIRAILRIFLNFFASYYKFCWVQS